MSFTQRLGTSPSNATAGERRVTALSRRRVSARPRRLVTALIIAAATLAVTACGSDETPPTAPMGGPPPMPDPLLGTADFSSYVAIGNSVTMGVLDGALLETGSRCSIPALLAGQAELIDFELPLYSDPGIVAFPPNEVGVVPGGRMTITALNPLTIERLPAGAVLNADLTRPYNNLGVSNALLAEALDVRDAGTSLIGNGLFDLVFRGFGTWAEQAAALEASFITVWLGNNDILIWAGAGGDAALTPGLPIPVEGFASVYGLFLDQLLAITDQIVLFNVPQIGSLPLFTTLPPVVIDPETNQPVLDENGDPIPLIGPDGPLVAGDLVILTASEFLLQGIGIPVELGGTGDPLPNAVILNVAEQGQVATTVDGYNTAIQAEATAHGLRIVDIAAVLDEVATTGVMADGELLTSAYLVGGTFGLDGVHPTCKGYGLAANALIDVINDEFGATIPVVSIAALEGGPLPPSASFTGADRRAGSALPFGTPRFSGFHAAAFGTNGVTAAAP